MSEAKAYYRGRQPNTERPIEIFRFIVKYKEDNNGISPTVAEIAEHMGGLSSSMVNMYLRTLQDQGRITLPPKGVARGIQVDKSAWVYYG